jgi:hypothetical protein
MMSYTADAGPADPVEDPDTNPESDPLTYVALLVTAASKLGRLPDAIAVCPCPIGLPSPCLCPI